MKTTLTIGTKTFDVRTSALTSTIYRGLFKADLTVEISKLQTSEEKNLELFKQLAFVMVWQAEPRTQKVTDAMKALTMDDYYAWLEDLEETDFYDPNLLATITTTWLGGNKSVVDLKNQVSPQ